MQSGWPHFGQEERAFTSPALWCYKFLPITTIVHTGLLLFGMFRLAIEMLLQFLSRKRVCKPMKLPFTMSHTSSTILERRRIVEGFWSYHLETSLVTWLVTISSVIMPNPLWTKCVSPSSARTGADNGGDKRGRDKLDRHAHIVLLYGGRSLCNYSSF